jgi:hypothetical protein
MRRVQVCVASQTLVASKRVGPHRPRRAFLSRSVDAVAAPDDVQQPASRADPRTTRATTEPIAVRGVRCAVNTARRPGHGHHRLPLCRAQPAPAPSIWAGPRDEVNRRPRSRASNRSRQGEVRNVAVGRDRTV